jgi:TnpA family transposase
MPANFLTQAQRKNYGRYNAHPTAEELARFFHLSDEERLFISQRRGKHSRLGFAIQLGTVRFLGTFLPDPLDVPPSVIKTMAKQVGITEVSRLKDYRLGRQHWQHA